jgi:glycosyltransferase involved in cell wall biosynthesis
VGSTDLVHVMWGDKDFGFIDLFAPHLHKPFCVTAHCCPDTLPEVFRHPGRLRSASAIILMSEIQRPFFEFCGVAPERIHVVHHGVDCDYFRPAVQKNGVFTVLSVGNYRRNFDRLKAVCVALAVETDICFRVIAPAHWRKFFENLPNVKFETGLSDDELRQTYQEASCLLMTVDAATANNALLEAMASGLPIVSEDVGGIAEYCGSEAAKLCPAGSVAALCEALVQLRDQPEEVSRMGVAARARAEALDWPKVAERMLPIYKQVLEERRIISQ